MVNIIYRYIIIVYLYIKKIIFYLIIDVYYWLFFVLKIILWFCNLFFFLIIICIEICICSCFFIKFWLVFFFWKMICLYIVIDLNKIFEWYKYILKLNYEIFWKYKYNVLLLGIYLNSDLFVCLFVWWCCFFVEVVKCNLLIV